MPAINSVPTRFQESFQKRQLSRYFLERSRQHFGSWRQQNTFIVKNDYSTILWIPDRDTSRLNLSRGVIEAFLLMHTRCILIG